MLTSSSSYYLDTRSCLAVHLQIRWRGSIPVYLIPQDWTTHQVFSSKDGQLFTAMYLFLIQPHHQFPPAILFCHAAWLYEISYGYYHLIEVVHRENESSLADWLDWQTVDNRVADCPFRTFCTSPPRLVPERNMNLCSLAGGDNWHLLVGEWRMMYAVEWSHVCTKTHAQFGWYTN